MTMDPPPNGIAMTCGGLSPSGSNGQSEQPTATWTGMLCLKKHSAKLRNEILLQILSNLWYVVLLQFLFGAYFLTLKTVNLG